MKCLHQECSDAANQSSEVGVHYPRSVVWQVQTTFIARCDYFEPRRNPIRVARKESAKALGERFLDGVVGQA
jgi:hypothetical protein